MRLLAISDLHLANAINREAFEPLADHGEDWVILAGDVAEKAEHLELAFRRFGEAFSRVFWVPGNHELWSVAVNGEEPLRGEARYRYLVELAREHGVVTPEDPFVEWPGEGPGGYPGDETEPGVKYLIAPLFLLYDYSFRPADVALADVRAWAEEEHTVCSDEFMLHSAPFASRADWCAQRCLEAEGRLAEIGAEYRPVLINHWPLRADLIRIPRVPRFTPWCGTTRTEDWHRRYRAAVVVTGHLHTRRTDWIDGTRFEEVSLGYPRQWNRSRDVSSYFREILPGR